MVVDKNLDDKNRSGFTGLPLMRQHRSCRSAGPFFSALPEKNGEKRGAGCESGCTAVPQNEPVEERCGQHTRISLQSYTTAPPAWRQRSHRKQFPRKKDGKTHCRGNNSASTNSPMVHSIHVLRGRWRAQPSATKERYGCGLPLAGAHRPAVEYSGNEQKRNDCSLPANACSTFVGTISYRENSNSAPE